VYRQKGDIQTGHLYVERDLVQVAMVYWEVTSYHQASSFICFKGLYCLHLQGLAAHEDCSSLKIKALQFLSTSGTHHPTTHYHIPGDLNLQQYQWENWHMNYCANTRQLQVSPAAKGHNAMRHRAPLYIFPCR